jgi:hypothetical protein
MKHVMDVLSLHAGHAMVDVIETTEVTEIPEVPHVMEGFAINSSPYGNTEVRLYA